MGRECIRRVGTQTTAIVLAKQGVCACPQTSCLLTVNEAVGDQQPRGKLKMVRHRKKGGPTPPVEAAADQSAVAIALERLADSIRMLASALRQPLATPKRPAVEQERPPSAIQVLLTPKQLAVELGVSVQTVAKWRLSGLGPRYCKFGAAVRYDHAEVQRWVDDRRYAHTAEQQAGRHR